jgi:AcrR family transcriptional regulator
LSLTADQAGLGRRERKKAQTRAEIQRHALRLIKKQGYAATTVSQIAEAADVSESTFFRYYPTKEDVVLQDDFDAPLFAAYAAQPPELGPIGAMRGAVHSVLGSLGGEDRAALRERTELILSVPELRASMAVTLLDTIEQAAALFAARANRAPEDFAVRVFAGALVGAITSATLLAPKDADYVELVDAALAQLEAGFTF